MASPCVQDVRLTGLAQAPATATDSTGTTLETAPRVAKAVVAGGGDMAEVADAACWLMLGDPKRKV